MHEQNAYDTVRRAITVQASASEAFKVFTSGLATWWPREYSWSTSDLETAEIEPREGGTWFERGSDGTTVVWGQVLTWEPPHKLVLTWQISPDREFEPDTTKASEIEVRFNADGPIQTRVVLEHRHFARHGTGGDTMREGMASAEGWSLILERFAASVT